MKFFRYVCIFEHLKFVIQKYQIYNYFIYKINVNKLFYIKDILIIILFLNSEFMIIRRKVILRNLELVSMLLKACVASVYKTKF